LARELDLVRGQLVQRACSNPI